jgi:hypothetical protein
LTCGIFSAAKLDFKILRFAADRLSGVKGSHWIDKKSGAGKFAVLVAGLNFDDGLGRAVKDVFNLATDCGSRVGLLLDRKSVV